MVSLLQWIWINYNFYGLENIVAFFCVFVCGIWLYSIAENMRKTGVLQQKNYIIFFYVRIIKKRMRIIFFASIFYCVITLIIFYRLHNFLAPFLLHSNSNLFMEIKWICYNKSSEFPFMIFTFFCFLVLFTFQRWMNFYLIYCQSFFLWVCIMDKWSLFSVCVRFFCHFIWVCFKFFYVLW